MSMADYSIFRRKRKEYPTIWGAESRLKRHVVCFYRKKRNKSAEKVLTNLDFITIIVLFTIGGMDLLLDVSRAMRAPGESFAFVHHERISPQDIYGEQVTFDDPVVLEGRFSMSDNDLTLDGTLTATAHSRCCNCLEMATVNLKVPFHEVFTKVDRIAAGQEEDPDRLVFTGSKVELEHLTLTLALLELPIRILCKPDCEGYKRLAPQYTAQPKESPFAVLQKLITKDQNDQEV